MPRRNKIQREMAAALQKQFGSAPPDSKGGAAATIGSGRDTDHLRYICRKCGHLSRGNWHGFCASGLCGGRIRLRKYGCDGCGYKSDYEPAEGDCGCDCKTFHQESVPNAERSHCGPKDV